MLLYNNRCHELFASRLPSCSFIRESFISDKYFYFFNNKKPKSLSDTVCCQQLEDSLRSKVTKIHTCCKGQNDGNPAYDVRPGKAPVQEAFSKEGNSHTGVDGQSQQSEKTCEQRRKGENPLSKP